MDIEEITFDCEDELRKKWKLLFPGGSLPDKISVLFAEIRKEWYKSYNKTKKGIEALNA